MVRHLAVSQEDPAARSYGIRPALPLLYSPAMSGKRLITASYLASAVIYALLDLSCRRTRTGRSDEPGTRHTHTFTIARILVAMADPVPVHNG